MSLAFSPDGNTLVTASSGNGLVKTWDAHTGRPQADLNAGGRAAAPVFSPDGRTLAVSTGSGVQLWDLTTGRVRSTLPTRSPSAVAFSPDGRTLAIGTGGSAELWKVELPDPARAIRDICGTIDASLTAREQSHYLHDQSAETGCQTAVR